MTRQNIVTGVSTSCLYPMDTLDSLKTLLEMGYRRFEVFLNSFEEIEKPFLRELKTVADYYGAEFTSVHPFTSALEHMLLFADYPKRTKEGFRLYYKYGEAAAYLGGRFVVIHGQRNSNGLSDSEYYERFGELTRFMADSGAVPAHENVREHRSAHPEFLREMREHLGDECAFVLDVKQCLIAGYGVSEVADAMGDRLVHIHLSDHSDTATCLLPGTGKFDFEGFKKLLEERNYNGAVMTEVYRQSFGEVSELAAAKKFTDSVFG